MNRAVLLFIAIAYGFSIALSLVVGLTGGYQSRLVVGFGVASMFVPTVAILIVDSTMQEKKVWSFGWNRFPLKYLPVALLLMPIVMHAVMLPLAASLWGRLPWEDWLTPQADGLYHSPAARNWGVLTTQGLVGRIAMNAGIGVIINSTLAFFEEIGWRAWMLPRLVNRMGARRAVVVAAVIWAFWHTPYALSGIHHLDGIPIVLTAVIMPIVIVGAGLIIGWLWVRTESIWIVALAHGALNNWGQYAFKFMGGPGQLGDGLVLGTGGLALLAVGSFLVARGLPSTLPLGASLGPPSVTAAQQAFAAGGGRRDDQAAAAETRTLDWLDRTPISGSVGVESGAHGHREAITTGSGGRGHVPGGRFMLNQGVEYSSLEKTEEQGLGLLKHWHAKGTTVWVYFATNDGGVGSALSARIAEVSRCLVFKNESSTLRLDLKNARLKYGPLQVLLTPSNMGRAAVVTPKPGGLINTEGVIVGLESGHSLFVCESAKSGVNWLKLVAAELAPGLLVEP